MSADLTSAQAPSRAPGWRALLLAVGVALAFADSSIVVLAVPDLLLELDAEVEEVAWVVTAYNLVLAAAAVLVVPALRARTARSITLLGLVLFTVAGVWCAFAPGLASLVAARALQGLGAALLLAGSLPLLGRLLPGRGLRAWAFAGAIGTAVGPALGGALTQVFDWRAVFVVQAPLAAAALAGVLTRGTAVPAGAAGAEEQPARTRSGTVLTRALQHTALLLVSGGLVGTLFLVVVMVVNGWGEPPLVAAAAATAVPLAAAVVRPVGRRLGVGPATVSGAALLALGLCGIALLPDASLLLVTGWLLCCGAGLGLSLPALVDALVGDAARHVARAGTWTTASRHVGLTLALLVVPGVLAEDLTRVSDDAVLTATATVLDVPLPLEEKVPLARALAEEVAQTKQGELPELRATVDRVRAQTGGDPAAYDRITQALDETVLAGSTRGFRRALLVTAALAATGVLVGALVWALGRRRPGDDGSGSEPSAGAAAGVAVLLAGALVVLQVQLGGTDYGSARVAEPCAPRELYAGDGVDATVQRVLLVGLERAGCRLGASRELVLLSLLPDEGQPQLDVEQPRLEEAVRAGLVEAIGEEQEQRGLNGILAAVLTQVVERVDVQDLLGQLEGALD